MLIPLDYRNEGILRHHERIWRKVRPGWEWPARHGYTSEYSWACDHLAAYVQQPHREARVMDAGGGCGSMQHVLAECYGECVNVDVNPRHLHPDCTPSILIQGDLEDTPMLEPGSFDGIVAISSIEHNPWDKIVRIVRNLLTLLKPGAPLVVTVPAFEVATYYAEGEWPEPHQKAWPECFNFDVDSFRELFSITNDMAMVAEPSGLPHAEIYRAQWRVIHDDMMTNSEPVSQAPYLSTGFVLRRR